MEQIVIKNRTHSEIYGYMDSWDACDPARDWIGDRDLKQCLADVDRIGWIVWLSSVLATECGKDEPALKEVRKLVVHYAHMLEKESDQLDTDKNAELAPIWHEYYAAKAQVVTPLQEQQSAEQRAALERHASQGELDMMEARHKRQWEERDRLIEATWQHYRDTIRPIEDKYAHKRDVRHRAAIRAIRRRVVVED